MVTRTAVSALAPSSLLVSLLLWGCTGSSPGTDPAIRHRFDGLADLLAELTADVESHEERIAELSQTGGGGGSTAEIARLQAADQELRRTIVELRQEIIALRQQIAEDGGTQIASAAPAARPAESEEDRAAGGPTNPMPDGPASDSPTAIDEPPPAETSEPRAVEPADAAPSAPGGGRGFYHTFRENETLESVAEHYGVSVDTILSENMIPPGSRVPPGQALFIPQAH